jgi:protein-S-isoprenylcysteine O-methyltransferase Ste14
MRHPIYTGHRLMGLGTAIASGSLVAFAGLASFVGRFWIKLNQEERLLRRGFPDEYPAYKARVKAPIPCVF